MLGINDTITADGYISGNGAAELNTSDIFSELIKAAGTYCERYSSDLIYDLDAINNSIQAKENFISYIGIRLNGVDGEYFIRHRIDPKSCSYEANIYIRLYRLAVVFDEDERTIIADLTRISEYEARSEIL